MLLNQLNDKQGKLHIFNSLLSEYGVVGFDYGYAMASPNTLTIWEAQFGDFSNGAQIMIDQYISAAEDKWKLQNGLVMLLPHGYEGQGAEHSSARMERYLQMCAKDNMFIADCTTPANMFHLLRRQLKATYRKPLVVFTPKSLLRHPKAVSGVADFANGHFQEVIGDHSAVKDKVKTLVFCTELHEENNCSFTKILTPNDDLCEASINNPIFTENWEDGINENWSISQLPENAAGWEAREWILKTNLPKGREGLAIYAPNPANGLESDGGGSCDTQHGIIRLESPTITMPNTTDGQFELAFTHNIATEPDYDGGNIKFSIDEGNTWALVPSSSFTVNSYNKFIVAENDNNNPMIEEDVFSGIDENSENSSWGQSVINLSSLGVVANSTIKFRWEFGSDGCNGNDGWYVDEIVVYNCASVLSVNSYDFLNKNVRILENPSSGIFKIKMQNISDFKYDIYDITGKTLQNNVKINKNLFNIDLTKYSKGLYFVKLYSNLGSITKKLIVK